MRLLTLAGVLGGVCTVLWLVPPAFSGIEYVDCSFDEGELHVRVLDEGGVIRRSGDRIQVLQPDGQGGDEPVDCGGAPTITNTDLIRWDIALDPDAGDTESTFSLRDGSFEPGVSPEIGVPEIEVVTTMKDEAGNQAIIEGSQEANTLRGGRIDGVNWLNLNAGQEGMSPDADMRFARAGKAGLGFDAHAGDDEIDLTGGPEFEAALRFKAVIPSLGPGDDQYRNRKGQSFVSTGSGNDRVNTGDKFDFVVDRGGKDVIKTHDGRDFIAAGRGADRISSGKGKDLMAVFDARGRIRCGGGRDRLFTRKHVQTKSCERVKIGPVDPRPSPFGD